VRREAAAQFRLCHWNRERGQVVFTEKGARGGRKIEKPMPEELARLIEAAETAGVYASEDDFVIPPRAALRRTDGTRSAAVLLKTVKKIGKRAGCSQAYVHAFRAAYAEHYVLEQRRNGHGDGDIKLGLQMIMGHKQAATTDIYLRRLDRSGYMEPARAFSWGSSPALPSTVGDTAPIHAGSGVETSPDLDGHPVGGAWLTEKEGFEPSTDATPQPESEPVQLPETFDLLDLLAGRHVDVPPSTPAGERLPAAAPTLDPDWTPEAGYSHADRIRRILEAKERDRLEASGTPALRRRDLGVE
jgi:hypothetical protein